VTRRYHSQAPGCSELSEVVPALPLTLDRTLNVCPPSDERSSSTVVAPVVPVHANRMELVLSSEAPFVGEEIAGGSVGQVPLAGAIENVRTELCVGRVVSQAANACTYQEYVPFESAGGV
jgi:hypothetical protein